MKIKWRREKGKISFITQSQITGSWVASLMLQATSRFSVIVRIFASGTPRDVDISKPLAHTPSKAFFSMTFAPRAL